ncbi:MAG: halogenase [Planctomyces sp.]|nr:halogenase [Planctomyces sp.]
MKSATSDLTILGGGLAGLTLALQVRQQLPTARITILEKRKHPAPEAAHKVGESSVEVGAHYFASVLGLKEHIVNEQLPKLGLRFFFPSGDNSRIEDRLEVGGRRYAPAPSYQLDRGRFENHLAERCLAEDIRFVDEANIKSFAIGRPHEVTYLRNGESISETSRWIVDASSRRAFIKRELGLEKDSPHVSNAVWFRIGKRIRVDDWSDDPEWQQGHEGELGRWYSTNHLMGKGYWVWLIPLGSGSTSVGIVAAEPHHSLSDFNSIDKAMAWLETHEPQCAAKVREHMDDLQDFLAIKNYSVESKQVFSADRWGITGEAGFFHDPFYSPGSDFIAFANTFLTNLITRDLTGRGIRIRSFAYDRIFKKFYYGTASVYHDQYQIFGNPQVMPVKVLWDYLIYWSLTGFIYMQGRMCEQTMYMRNLRKIIKLGNMNHFMQDFFREWHQKSTPTEAHGLINLSEMPIIKKFNEQLLEDFNSHQFSRIFKERVQQMETLMWEIIDESGLTPDVPFPRKEHADTVKGAFEHIFAATNRPSEPLVAVESR